MVGSLACLLLAGCSDVAAQLEGRDDLSRSTEVLPEPILTTLGWGELNGLVSVIVRNPTKQVLRRADAEITVLDAAGRTLASSNTSGIEAECCTAVNVPPGAVVGFYVQVPDGEVSVSGVAIRYRDVTWSDTTMFGGPVAEATATRLRPNRLGTQVLAEVATSGGIIERAVVQATIVDRSGDLIAVVSTTWDCLRPDEATAVRLQLFHRVPGTARIGGVSVFPDDRSRTGRSAPACA